MVNDNLDNKNNIITPNQNDMKDNAPLTMKDIARELGVSVATVSRALKDSPRISPERRALIQEYAREHNFTPNPIAEYLRYSRVQPIKIIGVIIPELAHYYFSTVLAGIEEEAYSRGYGIMVAQSEERYDKEVKICQSFYEGKVCGIIISQAKDTLQYDHFRKLQDAGLPMVFYDRICTGINASRVVVDDYMGAFNAVSYLIERGCTRIAFYSNRADAEVITPGVLEREDRPDGFFAVNDDTAIGILYTAKHMGFRVPDDISICGFTNGQRAVACDPMLTTVEQRGKRVGEEAASILIDKVEGHIPSDQVVKRVVRTKLIVRGTTK